MATVTEDINKQTVLEAFDTLFNKRDYGRAATFWSDQYIQHSAHIGPGRDGLFSLIQSAPAELRYEPGLIVAQAEYVIVHGRFSGTGRFTEAGRPIAWIAADIVRLADGKLVEHWDVLQDEATLEESKSGLPMFGAQFPPA
jgi:predicted SnoaL-like aldol condensation-catalyzing enzyme